MSDVLALTVTDATEEKLWAHGLALADALDVLDRAEFRTFTDPRHPRRRFMIGLEWSGKLVTLVIEAVDEEGTCLLITGWPSNVAEQTLYSRGGGTQYAG